jgi:branched-chain amino acid transport system permease protein
MISAAVAGLGGCLFAQEIGSVTADRFSLFESMAMLMLLVVAGAGYVSGGLSAGLLYGAVFVALGSIFAKIGDDFTALHGVSAWLVHFTVLLPALIGISLGRNPSGFLADSFQRYRVMIRDLPAVFVGGLAVALLAWFLAFQHVINNWVFGLFVFVLAVVLPYTGALFDPAAYRRRRSVVAAVDLTPVELIGIDRPFTADDLRRIDNGAGLEPGVRV